MRTLTNGRLLSRVCHLLTLTVMLSTLVTVFGPARASASAYGCASGDPNKGPSFYCVNLNGSGTYVKSVQGTYYGSALVCNSRITAEFFDTSWRWYQTYTSSTSGCSTKVGKTININANKRRGYMCSTLKYQIAIFGNRQMSVCHAIR